MNIVSKDILHPCTSCGGCAVVCPANAIVMVLNEQGFYRPVLDVDKCVDCSLCTKVCYKYDDVKPYNIAEHKEILCNTEYYYFWWYSIPACKSSL